MNPTSRDRLAILVSSSIDIPSKLENLRRLNQNLLEEDDVSSLSEFLPRLFKLQSDQHSPVRKCVAQYDPPCPDSIEIHFSVHGNRILAFSWV